jgi:thiol-disulfide isomerase/thioredoxin
MHRNGILSKEYTEEYGEYLKTLSAYNRKYRKQLNEYHKIYIAAVHEDFERNKRPQIEDSIFTHVLKIKPGLLYDLIQMEKYKKILDIRLFTAGEKEEVKRSFTDNQLLAQALIDKNNEIEKMFASVKLENNVTVNENPAVENEKLMETILEKYRGKVVFVNFWKVWDTPCLDAMKTILPVKEELQAKDIVFLYITGETSSIFEWIKKTPEIHGEHYRLTEKQWDFLRDKFDIKGEAIYIIYDKNGNLASELYNGYPGNETVKNAIEKELSK